MSIKDSQLRLLYIEITFRPIAVANIAIILCPLSALVRPDVRLLLWRKISVPSNYRLTQQAAPLNKYALNM